MPSPTTVVTGSRANWGVSDCGQLMGQPPTDTGLASIEPEGTYEHLAIGVLEEGYSLIYKKPGAAADDVKFDVFGSTQGIVCVGNHICRNDRGEFVKSTESRTDDGLLTIRQTFTISKNATRVIIRMEITNCLREKSLDLTDFLVKRYADIDVDTGGTAGWANFAAYWDRTRYSCFTYNLDGDAPKGKRSHIVNMVAMPSDLVLDEPFVGRLGSQQYNQRKNIDPVATPTPTRTDCDGVLQWHANRFLAGEMFRINMYYDTFRSFAK
jgi:hypothetical protein